DGLQRVGRHEFSVAERPVVAAAAARIQAGDEHPGGQHDKHADARDESQRFDERSLLQRFHPAWARLPVIADCRAAAIFARRALQAPAGGSASATCTARSRNASISSRVFRNLLTKRTTSRPSLNTTKLGMPKMPSAS